MKKIIGIMLVSLLISLQSVTIQGTEQTTTPEADYLNALGLLRGTTMGYELDKTMTRVQGSVMIVRLLGQEQSALAANFDHPFSDVPDWANPYVGYMYQNALTTGQGGQLFGADALMTEAQYYTFILRALGYDDLEGDFHWADAFKKAREIGMINAKAVQSSSDEFLRDDMVKATYFALGTPLKNKTYTLEDYLEDMNVLPPTIDTAKLIYEFETVTYVKVPVTIKQLNDNLSKMIYGLDKEQSFDVGKLGDIDLAALMQPSIDRMTDFPGYSSVLSKYNMSSKGEVLTVTMDFNLTARQLDAAKKQAYMAVTTMINPEMSDFEKELAIHDYIVNRVSYDTSKTLKPASYTLYGALVEGRAVCHGYAESFQLMAYLVGLESEIVLGDAVSNGVTIGHAWNLITIGGDTYHVDTTWDDPVMADGSNVLSYSYFNLNDESMGNDHHWDANDYKATDAVAYNYYVYNKQVVYTKAQLKEYMQNAFNQGTASFSVKMLGEALTPTDIKTILLSCYGYGQITYRLDNDTNIVVIDSIG